MAVKDFVVDNDIDVLAMTETWLRPGTDNSVEIGTLCPTGYRVIHMTNNLHDNFQSAYNVHHSNGTVMVKMQDDIRLCVQLTAMKPLHYLC